MKIICLVKFIPDVENFIYDFERNVLVRENVNLVLNPDDACALAFALKLKEKKTEVFVEIVTMAPTSSVPLLEDLLRRGADKATLISDKLYVGSDTYVTSQIIGKYLKDQVYDCILTGTHALDGDTSHVPAQIGEILNISQLSHITKIDEDKFNSQTVEVQVDSEDVISIYAVDLPAILSIQRESKYKLPFVKFKDIGMDVSQRMTLITNCDIGFEQYQVGLLGSLTKVSRAYVKQMEKRNKVVVRNDEEGISRVYTFLKEKGFV